LKKKAGKACQHVGRIIRTTSKRSFCKGVGEKIQDRANSRGGEDGGTSLLRWGLKVGGPRPMVELGHGGEKGKGNTEPLQRGMRGVRSLKMRRKKVPENQQVTGR